MRRVTTFAATLLFAITGLLPQTVDPFLEKPYLQLGDNAKLASPESMMLLFHTANRSENWSVEVLNSHNSGWRIMPAPVPQLVRAGLIPPHHVWRAALTGLDPGEIFRYRVKQGGTIIFDASGKARTSANQAVRFLVFGDAAERTASQRLIAWQASQQNADFLLITGDIVYEDGRISEYREKFYPVYNADRAARSTGAPLLRSIPFIAAPGNHDTDLESFRHFPDSLAYFLYWDQPLNGPRNNAFRLLGNHSSQPAFRAAAQNRWPRMANYSFDYGNTHWTVLDSNAYMDWSSRELRKWLTDDLAAAQGAAWRFVAFHHAPFSSSRENFRDQWMRLLAPVFEAGNVDLVFSGHVHNYQRSVPLSFTPLPQPTGMAQSRKGEVAGNFSLDVDFQDGASAKPKGVIYIVTGGGGAVLYNPEQTKRPQRWQPFTRKFIANVHSLTVVDIKGSVLELRQISETGAQLDAFRILK